MIMDLWRPLIDIEDLVNTLQQLYQKWLKQKLKNLLLLD
jgi:hypothetical protein